MVYISIDGNNIGKIIEYYILENKLEELSDFSRKLSFTTGFICKEILRLGGKIIMAGGDNILACISIDALNEITKITADNSDIHMRFSIGIGSSATASYLALKYAKAKKSNSPIMYDGSSFIDINSY